ncbi:ribokinase family protein [Aspergillus clavatus NRRL 1]|uniref:PfkB family carbohydrate kinase (Mak32), putative n=1 Tax=Aspergillus clavatus (strain ATCC 1007 / CBS 513.65 / DSM 816 / NCTC 3887 / NRRL 1 / QM 1276 / 107) TaxID=344612 RepID=A1CPI7_ASPCL|nr:PfkB family carbohydrate kinase (Mak32), putative [Aspergillus clavatus NRRL 1]EAW07558.1 PfkB family carbohydrate kinase (Mak32), putative [Aspergillus clavatus NRRL 1]
MAQQVPLAEGVDNEVEFCTLGMFILDEIEFGGSRPDVKNVIGGAASYAVIGARLVAGKEHSNSVSWIVDVGSDFPAEVLDVIKTWDTGCVIREDPGRLTTRAWNGYGVNEKRDFKYLTPKLRLEPSMLSDSQVISKTFHMVCSSSRCISIVEDIMRRRDELQQAGKVRSAADATTRPIFVWEPVPDLCTPEEKEKFFEAARVVDVVSPNELELGMMFGQPGWSEDNDAGRDVVATILQSGIGPKGEGHLVIRAGKDGSYTFSRKQRIWFPAYHQPSISEATAVVDPTGAGNSFLGALAQGLISAGRDPGIVIDSVFSECEAWQSATRKSGMHDNMPMALICATVAAGYVVEQIGVPRMTRSSDGRELWNGTEFTERVRLYTQKLYRTLEESPRKHFRNT